MHDAGCTYLPRIYLITIHLDTQCTCVFVWLKKGVEKTQSTVDQVIQKVKDALMKECDQDIVPKDCFVQLEVKVCGCIYFKEVCYVYTSPLVSNEV